MEGYMGNGRGIGMGTTMRGKLKRKDIEELDQVSHDFSDFSLSSPARKIRRLDAELPPIMEEEEPEIFTTAPSPSPSPMAGGGSIRLGGGIVIEELDSDPDPSPPQLDDKAIVLFNPANPLLMHRSPSTYSVSVNSDLISGFKDQFMRYAQHGQQKLAGEDDETVRNSNNSNECRAVVPWAPSRVLPPASGMEASQALTEPPEVVMEAEDTMEIEDGTESLPQGQSNHGYGGIWGAGEGLRQWQQQHCMIPHPPHHTSTPITWFK